MEEKKRISQVNWDKVYKPKIQGGLGLRILRHLNMALWGKLAWKVSTGENMKWIHICQKKYLQDGSNFLKADQFGLWILERTPQN